MSGDPQGAVAALDPGWERLALAPPRAVESVIARARLRSTPEDFQVDEQLGFEPSGAGEHLLLRVRKCGANTGWVARELATRAGARQFEVGYAGLKDRNAVTTQWFTVPRRKRAPEDWQGVHGEGWQVLEAHAHARKLPRGALAGNRFRIVLRDVIGDRAVLESRLATMAREGVPNYFGPQRFGRGLSNLRALLPGAPPQREIGFAVSAARSLIFNAVLAERIAQGSWNRLFVAERANLDGRNSSFVVETVDATLEARLAEFDVHPTGPMWGEGESGVEGVVNDLEQHVATRFADAIEFVTAARVEFARRPLRVAVREFEWAWLDADALQLSFALRAGSFATAVIRELLDSGGEVLEDEHA